MSAGTRPETSQPRQGRKNAPPADRASRKRIHSRLMDHTNCLNAGSLALEKRVAADDRPDYLVISSVYDLPFGGGKHFGANANRVVTFVLGNWQVAGAHTWYEGAPLGWGNLIYHGGDLNYNPHQANVATFPSQFNTLRIDKMNNFNVNPTKSFGIHENIKVRFRAEFFNLCNRPLFEAPSLTATSPTFGYITSATNSPRAIQLALRLTF